MPSTQWPVLQASSRSAHSAAVVHPGVTVPVLTMLELELWVPVEVTSVPHAPTSSAHPMTTRDDRDG
jgi:hypothetical protein